MRILIFTPFFFPSMGGLETVTDTLAQALAARGHQVIVQTPTPSDTPERSRNYRVLRRPNFRKIFYEVKLANVVIHNSISLRNVWPMLFHRPLWLVVHHMTLPNIGIKGKLLSMIKKCVSQMAVSVGVSRFIADHFGGTNAIIHNPVGFTYLMGDGQEKSRDIVFSGRLIRDKGAHVLLDAALLLKQKNPTITVTIIGDGPEKAALKAQTRELGLSEQITFTGRMHGDAVRNLLRLHKVMAVPSIWTEPFGVTALEGLASGCQVVVSNIGGLPEAVGECGILVKANDAAALAEALKQALTRPFVAVKVARHLDNYRPDVIADQFEQLIHVYLKAPAA